MHSQYIHRRLTLAYILALGLIAVLIISDQIMVHLSLQQQSHDAHLINTAGRQRMLSQQLSKLALQLQQKHISAETYSAYHLNFKKRF